MQTKAENARKRSLFAGGASALALATGGVRVTKNSRNVASSSTSRGSKKNMSQLLHGSVANMSAEEKKRRNKVTLEVLYMFSHRAPKFLLDLAFISM